MQGNWTVCPVCLPLKHLLPDIHEKAEAKCFEFSVKILRFVQISPLPQIYFCLVYKISTFFLSEMAEQKILKFKFYSNNITYFLSNLIGTDCKVELIFVSQSFLIFAILNNLKYILEFTYFHKVRRFLQILTILLIVQLPACIISQV